MKRQDALAVAAVAAVTMVFALVAFGPAGVGAGDDPPALRAEIAQPTLISRGCEFTLKTDKPAYRPDETPVLELTAVNPTGATVVASVWLQITAASPRDLLARMPTMPTPIWIRECKLTLSPGETKTVNVTADVKLPTGQSIAVGMSDRDTSVLARTLVLPRQNAATTQRLPSSTLPPAAREP